MAHSYAQMIKQSTKRANRLIRHEKTGMSFYRVKSTFDSRQDPIKTVKLVALN